MKRDKGKYGFIHAGRKMYWIFVVGTAGSGKSLLSASLEKWFTGANLSTTVVNLDPGVEKPPYISDVDIREYVDYGEVMSKFGLGPNGALVASLDMAVNHVTTIREEIIDFGRDYVIVDCPGQMELFAYRNSGPLLISSLSYPEPSVSLYLMDANIARTPTGYLSSMLLGFSINIRFGLPQLTLLSKIDILSPTEIEKVLQWGDEPYDLEEALNSMASGLVRDYAFSALQMLKDLGGAVTVLPVSAKEMNGVERVYGELQKIFLGGENIYEEI